jgi:hypothetical protein
VIVAAPDVLPRTEQTPQCWTGNSKVDFDTFRRDRPKIIATKHARRPGLNMY